MVWHNAIVSVAFLIPPKRVLSPNVHYLKHHILEKMRLLQLRQVVANSKSFYPIKRHRVRIAFVAFACVVNQYHLGVVVPTNNFLVDILIDFFKNWCTK